MLNDLRRFRLSEKKKIKIMTILTLHPKKSIGCCKLQLIREGKKGECFVNSVQLSQLGKLNQVARERNEVAIQEELYSRRHGKQSGQRCDLDLL